MDFNLSEFCFNNRITLDGVIYDGDLQKISEKNHLIFNHFNEKDPETLFKIFMENFGEFEKSERCGQCGNYDKIINLSI